MSRRENEVEGKISLPIFPRGLLRVFGNTQPVVRVRRVRRCVSLGQQRETADQLEVSDGLETESGC